MKTKIIFFLSVLLSSLTTNSQTIYAFYENSDTQNVDIEEEYLIKILKNIEVVFCKVDTVNDWIKIKDMEVQFIDTSVFVSAYLESTFFTDMISRLNKPTCGYIKLYDRFGNSLVLEEIDFRRLESLKKHLDVIITNTPYKEYSGKYPNTSEG